MQIGVPVSTGGTYERLHTYSCVYFHFRAFARNSDRGPLLLRYCFHSSSSDRSDGSSILFSLSYEYNVLFTNLRIIFKEREFTYPFQRELYMELYIFTRVSNKRRLSEGRLTRGEINKFDSVIIYGSDSASFSRA